MTVDELIVELQKQSAAGNGSLGVVYTASDNSGDWIQYDVRELNVVDWEFKEGAQAIDLT